MASRGSVYSQTLHDITNTKLDELAAKRKTFEFKRGQIKAVAESDQNAIKRLDILAVQLKNCFSISTSGGRVIRGSSNNPRLEIDIKNLDRFLAQAHYDPSVSSRIMQQWQQTLLRHVEIQSLKFSYASLYGQLTTEWLSTNKRAATAPSAEDAEMEDFQHVTGGKKLESRARWEQSVFEAKNIDKEAIAQMLRGLFESKPEDSMHLLKAMKELRCRVARFEEELASPGKFDEESLKWTIRGLLASDLLDDEKQDALRDFQGNTTILGEIADVLNMRMTALDDWSWGKEVLLEERRQLNGTYNIYMHEDLLQAIFLHYIGVQWSVFWKSTFSDFRKFEGVWKTPRKSISAVDKKRLDYFVPFIEDHPNQVSKKQSIYRKGYFVSQLLDSVYEQNGGDEGDEEADFEDMQVHVQQQAPRKRTKQTARRSAPGNNMGGVDYRMDARSAGGVQAPGEFDWEDQHDDSPKPKNTMEAKQNLLHLLSTDILIKTRLNGELTCFRSQIDTLYPSLPHGTVDSVMRFLGMSDKWLGFFNRFLKAPLRFTDDGSTEPRQRENGTPGSHVLSEVFGEVVLFCVDFQLNQETGGENLWRMGDDFWFWSSNHATCVTAWALIGKFMKTTGLELNKARTGAVRICRQAQDPEKMVSLNVGDSLPHGQIRWGMLYLNPDSGRFEIDQKMVDKHTEELGRQLKDKTNNIFAWIQAWNSYAATFFSSNFGKTANCFGRQHVDNMLATHERIQRQIFSSSSKATGSLSAGNSGSVIEFLRQTIEQRFGVRDIPDGYFYFPTELGGLEVRNSFIGLLQIRDTVHKKPSLLLDEYQEEERETYKWVKNEFEKRQVGNTYSGTPDNNFKPADGDTFFSFEEFIRYREFFNFRTHRELVDVLSDLLKRPEEESIETDDSGTIKIALNALGTRPGLRGILSNWYSMEPYWKWVAQLYGPEMIAKFGGLGIVEPGLLPMGMVSLFRSGRVKWQE